MVFDYIIVGAGSAGAVLANRLSAFSHISVCLIEAGPKDTSPAIHIPFGLALMSKLKGINWQLNTQAEPHLNNRTLYWPRGKTLGGSSSVNAMCYIRGAAENYDEWSALGADGWDYESVLPYFKKSEDNERGACKIHGAEGEQSVSDLKYINPVSHQFVQSAIEVGLPLTEDFNAHQEGVGYYQVTQKNGQRCSTAKGFLAESIRNRPNLVIMTDTTTKRVLFRSKQATGVEIVCKGQTQYLQARKRVILSAGAIGSPQLLLQSGVGQTDTLVSHEIELVHHLPGVGKNLQDHLDGTLVFTKKGSESYGLSLLSVIKNAFAPFRYLFKREGMFTSNIAEGGAFFKSDETQRLPDVQIHFLPAILIDHGRKLVKGHGFTFHFCNLYPKSRGEISLSKSTDGFEAKINANYLGHPDDINSLIEAYKWCCAVAKAQPLSQGSKVKEASHLVKSDEEIAEYIRANAETVYHPVGTCKMGASDDEMAVVSPNLSVYGLSNLNVIDASIMPTIIGGNTNAPTIMIAEKGADMIIAQDELTLD